MIKRPFYECQVIPFQPFFIYILIATSLLFLKPTNFYFCFNIISFKPIAYTNYAILAI